MNQVVQMLVKNAAGHIQSNEFTKAKEFLIKAREVDSRDPNPLRLMAVIAAMEFKFSEALNLIEEAIRLEPNNGIAHSNRGNVLKELGRYDEALNALDIAIKLSPAYSEAYNNRGNVLQEMNLYEESLGWYDKAIALHPQYAEAFSNKGNALVLLGRSQEAMQCFHQATAINPQYVDAYWHKALTQLSYGEFEDGWQNYEARWFKTHGLQLQHQEIPRLETLENVSGKKVLIWAEQGLGDTLQFCRYIQPLSQLGAQITFVVPKPLVKVLNSLEAFCNLAVSISEEEKGKFDFQSPLLSLPLLFNTRIDTIPAKIPYLLSDPKIQETVTPKLSNAGHLKVGVIWNGGFRADSPELWAVNKRRNIELDVISRLQDVSGVDFYSVQKGDPAESEFVLRKDRLWPGIVNLAPLLNDFSDTAAVMENLDLIISVDTSSAHLAGALGRPVWILNRYDSCWRWLRGREDSPWYPTAKIYHQKQPGNWDEVIERVKIDLSALAQKKTVTL